MSLSRFALALVLAPAVALAQGAGALGSARGASEDVRAGTDVHTGGVDAASTSPVPVDEPAASPTRPPHVISGIEIEGEEPGDGPGGQGRDAPAETYTVQRGDTLWDLSAKFLNSPWYWPRLWSYNPQIANPHWIYPGNVVRFYPGGDGRPPRIEIAAGDAQQRAGPDTSTQPSGDDDVVTVGGRYKIGFVPAKGVHTRRDSFVTPQQVAESGVITAAFEEKLLLSIHDRAYARFASPNSVRPGGIYLLYNRGGEVRHPRTGELFGYQSSIIGAGRVLSVDGQVATIEIVHALDPIERGTLIGPWSDAAAAIARIHERKNDRELSGVIVATRQDLSEIGEYHVVFVDKGRADGVEEGNVFTVVRSGDPYGKNRAELLELTHAPSPDLPLEDVGALMVIDVQQSASTALVVRSIRELYVGDKVEMRLASASRH